MTKKLSRDELPAQGNAELVHEQVRALCDIRPAPENSMVYRSISVDDVVDLAADIRTHGMLEPILISSDGFIISGHRRYFTAQLLKLSQVPVKVHPVSRKKNPKEFLRLLVGANTQRIKGADTLLAEAAVKVDPLEAHANLRAKRIAKEVIRKEDCTLNVVASLDDGQRFKLSPAKRPLLKAILRIIEE